MNKTFLFILCVFFVYLGARTWEERTILTEANCFGKNGLQHLYDDSLGRCKLYFEAWEPDYICKEGTTLVEKRNVYVRNDSLSFDDSIWVSKYYLDDSLLHKPILQNPTVFLEDFRLLNFSSTRREYYLADFFDKRLKSNMDGSFLILYKKDSLYYALCLLEYGYCDVAISCQFQDDGTTVFEKLPEKQEQFLCPTYYFTPRPLQCMDAISKQTPSAIPEHKSKFAPCLVNGSRATGKASSVIIDGVQSKIKLKRNGE